MKIAMGKRVGSIVFAAALAFTPALGYAQTAAPSSGTAVVSPAASPAAGSANGSSTTSTTTTSGSGSSTGWWGLIGLVGLLGLFGMGGRRSSTVVDSYDTTRRP